jgi:hypothetical protein
MSNKLEHAETTLVYDYHAKTVELYTTDRRVFLRAIARNPEYIKAEDLKPGYRVLYPLSVMRAPESVLKPLPGGDEVLHRDWLSDTEKANRASASERLKKVRPGS